MNYMTALQNITSAMSIKKIKKEDNKKFALDMIKRVGLTEEQANQKVINVKWRTTAKSCYSKSLML